MEQDQKHIKIADRVSTRLKLKQLRLLVAIAQHKSILHAARELNMSQPAATKLLKDLEVDFGVQLFERTNRGVNATTYGETLVRHGKLVLAQISHAAQELDDLGAGSGGRVVVGTLLAASAVLLPMTIEQVQQQRPNVSIAVKDGTNDVLMPLLRSGDMDLVVGRLPEYRHREELVQEALFDEQVLVLARPGHPLCRKAEVTFEELTGYKWIMPPPETTLRRQMDKEFLDRGFEPPVNPLESISFLTNKALLMSTDMLGVAPYHVIQHEIGRGDIAALPLDLKMASSPVGVTHRREGGLSPAAAAFLAQLRITAGSLQPGPA